MSDPETRTSILELSINAGAGHTGEIRTFLADLSKSAEGFGIFGPIAASNPNANGAGFDEQRFYSFSSSEERMLFQHLFAGRAEPLDREIRREIKNHDLQPGVPVASLSRWAKVELRLS